MKIEDSVFNKCVYTIVNLDVIDRAIQREDASGFFIEKKRWAGAEKFWRQALAEGKQLLLLLADASYIDGVIAIAIIDEIELLKEGGSKISFYFPQYLTEFQALSKLRLLSSEQPLSDGYIRPYALCVTPDFAYKYAEDLVSSIEASRREGLVEEFLDENKSSNSLPPRGVSKPNKIKTLTTQYERDALVREWVLNNASGICECCKQKAPFISDTGLPFLEVHHLRQLSEAGSDKISNAVALCPNCHRELHYGILRTELVQNLYRLIGRLVPENK